MIKEWLLKDVRESDRVFHPSTQGAITALRHLAAENHPLKILDIGCGSGLLSLVASELWPQATIIASDIHTDAVENAEENIKQAGKEGCITVIRSNGYQSLASYKPFNLIISNLVAETLVSLARHMTQAATPDSTAILSGIQLWQADQVLEPHLACGWKVTEKHTLNQWITITLQKYDNVNT